MFKISFRRKVCISNFRSINRYPFGTHNIGNAGKLGILGAGFHGDGCLDFQGVKKGPEGIRNDGLINNMKELGYDITDYGDLKFTFDESIQHGKILKNDGKEPSSVAMAAGVANLKIADMVEKSFKENDKTLVLGGDNIITVGSLIGHSRVDKDICCIYINAHPDINSPCTSLSGNIHGQVFHYVLDSGYLRNKNKSIHEGFSWSRQVLRPERLAYIGIRELDQIETKILKDLGLMYMSMHEIDKDGMMNCLDQCLRRINPSFDRPTHICFNVNSLDPDYASATPNPVAGGLTLRDALFIGEYLNVKGVNVKVIDIVELNPDDPKDGEKSTKHTNYVIKSLMGHFRGGQYAEGYEVPIVE